MEDYEKDWDKYKTPPVRQFDLIMRDILDILKKEPLREALQYVRGLRDGNRFARECPEITPLKSLEKIGDSQTQKAKIL